MKKIYKLLIILLVLMIMVWGNLTVYADNELSINAKAALIVETNTGKIIYDKNCEEQNYPASVTKILTAIITIENCKLDDVAKVSQYAISHVPSEYVVAPLKVGEEIRVEDLLYALMLKSANDAAYVLAEHVGESVEGFANIMNKKAEEIGCKNTHFVNPNGIHNSQHYTTAYDLYLISNYAMKNETFAKIVGTYQYILPATNKYPYKNRVMTNTNLFINPGSSFYNKNVKGIKTGTTVPAGNCLITDSAEGGLEFITVVLGATSSNGKFSETSKMIKYAFDNYTLTKLHDKGDLITTVEVDNATEDTKSLNVLISDEITVMNNVNINLAEIVPEIKLNENIVAPINVGDEIGTIRYEVDGLEYSGKLLAGNDVKKRTYEKEVTSVIIGIIIVDVLLVIIMKIKKKRRR